MPYPQIWPFKASKLDFCAFPYYLHRENWLKRPLWGSRCQNLGSAKKQKVTGTQIHFWRPIPRLFTQKMRIFPAHLCWKMTILCYSTTKMVIFQHEYLGEIFIFSVNRSGMCRLKRFWAPVTFRFWAGPKFWHLQPQNWTFVHFPHNKHRENWPGAIVGVIWGYFEYFEINGCDPGILHTFFVRFQPWGQIWPNFAFRGAQGYIWGYPRGNQGGYFRGNLDILR